MDSIQVPFGYIKDGKVFQKSWDENPDREIGEVRDNNPEKSAQFFQERFSDMEKKIAEVTEKIDSTENKGSFLMKLVHLREHLPQHDGLGDYQVLQEKILKYESLVRDIIQKNRVRNTEIKNSLLAEAKEAVEVINWKEATELINDIKSRWIKTGSAEEDKNKALEESFWGVIEDFFDRKKQFFEDKIKLTDHRKRQYQALIDEAKKLADIHGKERFTKVKGLKENWKEIGGIPAEFYQPLNDEFNQLLKGKRYEPPKDYTELLSKLEAIKARKVAYDGDELGKTKKELFRDRAKNPDKFKCLELIQLLNEREFIIKLANKRFPDFEKLEVEKKKNIKSDIIKNLISRDEEDLKTYEDNSSNFSSPDGKMNKLVESKIKSQKRKIDVKSKLLEWVDSGEF
ncbi:DUF349 domain-containing protein [Ekhidna sp. To15]|uniref:DUF349 domain-containing protein n=1 Tax=Ekhidna sp. To15 TaxID=3395267 RepID=UPI003F5243CD